MNLILQILTLLGGVTLFLYGLSLLSGGLQKVAGDGLRSFLASMTSNPFKQILTGIGTTAVIQSSTATTIMVVSFVNAGLIVLGQAVGVIMGAHIGTTITSWIMAVFGFSFNMADFAFPMFVFGFFLFRNKKQQRKDLGEIIMGFALFFIGFAQLRSTAQVLVTPERLGFLQSWTEFGFGSIMLFLFIGIVLTVCFQSSAATMAIIMILITTGVIPFKMAAAMILGENIGTTIAANIAASVGNLAAKRTAISHTVMNTFGVLWVLCIFPLFLKLVGGIVSMFGLPDPNTADLTDTANSEAITTSLLYSVCTMHTLFNIANTSILVWFIPTIVKIVKWIYPDKEGETEVFRLKYISGGPLSTAELSLEEANKEIVDFARICRKGFGYVRLAVNETDDDKFEQYRAKLVKYEEITDRMEQEIASYLNEVSRGELSERSSRRIKGMYRIIGEMESLGDSGESISRTLQRARAHSKRFDQAMIDRINGMVEIVDSAYQAMQDNLAVPYGSLTDISNASSAEDAINECRNRLREEHITKMEQDPEYSYQTGVFYMDIVADLEKIGDFIINISEAKVKE